jgi:transcriptional regulator with XRE-family HTH domain
MSQLLSDRISLVVASSKLSKTKFAEQINISQPYLSQLCAGIKTPSDRTITDICREFNVNEVWLRTGDGEPYQAESRQEQIMKFAVQTIKGSDEFRKQFVSMLAKLDVEDWEVLAKIYNKMAGEEKK